MLLSSDGHVWQRVLGSLGARKIRPPGAPAPVLRPQGRWCVARHCKPRKGQNGKTPDSKKPDPREVGLLLMAILKVIDWMRTLVA